MARRAAGEQEKETRRREILARADALFYDRNFDEIKMADIAADLGLAKGTLYLYFPSKESLFKALLGDRLDAAFVKFFGTLGAGEEATIEGVAHGMAATMAEDLALPRLLAVMHSVLERKLPFEEAVAFKRGLAATLSEAGTKLAAALPPLSPEMGGRFFLYLYAQIVGLASLSDLSPFMRKASAEKGLQKFNLRFDETLEDSARTLLAGFMNEARGKVGT